MIVDGEHTFPGPRETVWGLLQDPEVLAKAMPGARRLTLTGPGAYQGVIRIGVGPVTAAEWSLNVTLADQVPPESYVMLVDSKGALGFTRGQATVNLDEVAGGTRMRYHADLSVGGKVAGVGQRLLDQVARMLTKQGLDALNKELEARLPRAAPPDQRETHHAYRTGNPIAHRRVPAGDARDRRAGRPDGYEPRERCRPLGARAVVARTRLLDRGDRGDGLGGCPAAAAARRTSPTRIPMKPAPFAYHRPDTVEGALALLAEHGYDAKLLAGGQSLVPAMNFRLAAPPCSSTSTASPASTRSPRRRVVSGSGRWCGSGQAERSALLAERAPLIAETLPYVAHAQIRNRGTMGGSIAHADPAAELPAVMLALGPACSCAARRMRTVAADDFFTGLFGTALEPEEMLVEIEIPTAAPGTGFAFDEISRRHGDFALAGVAASVQVDAEGRCTGARIALLSVGDGPVLAAHAAAALQGRRRPTTPSAPPPTPRRSRTSIRPGDIHATPAYRRQLVEVLVRRGLPRAFERARA
jgi:CO/xanthine dehydrogenase FAD-binding subunit/carbon monoxide dehydrogenase subunit G